VVLGYHVWLIVALFLAVDLGVVLLTVHLARRVLRDERDAQVAGWLQALFPAAILAPAQPNSFSLTALGVLALAILLWDAVRNPHVWRLGLAGVIFGGVVLVRPATASIGLLVVLAFVAILRYAAAAPRVYVGFGAFVLGCIACVAPAVAHNHAAHQGWTISTANEQNFWFGNNPYTPNFKTWELGQRPPTDFPPPVARYLERFGTRHPTRAQRHAMLREAVRYIRQHPATTAFRTINRVEAFWGYSYTEAKAFKRHLQLQFGPGAFLYAAAILGYCVVAVAALAGLVGDGGFVAGGKSFVVVAIVAFQLAYVTSYAAGVWHAPVVPLVAVVAASAWRQLREQRARQRLLRRKAFWLAVVVFVAIQAEYTYFGRHDRVSDHARTSPVARSRNWTTSGRSTPTVAWSVSRSASRRVTT
jgi:hypothetical protein